jgi:hypothetical protein
METKNNSTDVRVLGDIQRSLVFVVEDISGDTSFQNHGNHLGVAVSRGDVEKSVTFVVDRVNVG